MKKVKGTVCLYISLLAKHNNSNADRIGNIVATIIQLYSVIIIAAQKHLRENDDDVIYCCQMCSEAS
jgi:hypothetical protein